MKIIIHQTHETIADFDSISHTLQESFLGQSGLHLFPELFLTGYPLQDLCLTKSFLDSYIKSFNQIDQWAKSLDNNLATTHHALMGALEIEWSTDGLPVKLMNSICALVPGVGLQFIYQKKLLPNYDIFDEKKYFKPGTKSSLYEVFNQKVGILLCEDMWASVSHDIDPVQILKEEMDQKKINLDLVINLSASPYDHLKQSKRLARAQEISHTLHAPFIYVNRVGGEDEILFDGHSFVMNGDELLCELPAFKKESKKIELPTKAQYKEVKSKKENNLEALYAPQVEIKNNEIKLKSLTESQCQEITDALIFGVQEYARKNNFRSFLVALSGGMDSALVLTLLKLGLKEGQTLEAIYMPGLYSQGISSALSEELCARLQVKLHYLPIKFLHTNVKNLFGQTFREPFQGLTDENVQSRLRGMLLYTRSNQTGAMVINTSNKSEIAVGYSTQYGDSVGAISMLGDLYKSEVFEVARFINSKYNLIPEGIITRPPSAELRADQKDEDSLPPYPRLDTILECILSLRMTGAELTSYKLPHEEVTKVLSLYSKSEYKRGQFCPIIKVKSKSFGFGYRIPTSKNTNFYKI